MRGRLSRALTKGEVCIGEYVLGLEYLLHYTLLLGGGFGNLSQGFRHSCLSIGVFAPLDPRYS